MAEAAPSTQRPANVDALTMSITIDNLEVVLEVVAQSDNIMQQQSKHGDSIKELVYQLVLI